METVAVTEQEILTKLRGLDSQRWPQVLDFISDLAQSTYSIPSLRERKPLTAQELLNSDVVGLWEDREDIGDSIAFARQLRQQAETRGYAL